MDSPQVLTLIIAGCAAFVLLLFFYKIFVKVLKFLLKGAICGFGFMACNALLSMAGIGLAVGINIVTILIAAFLGIPGFIMLYAVQIILR